MDDGFELGAELGFDDSAEAAGIFERLARGRPLVEAGIVACCLVMTDDVFDPPVRRRSRLASF